MNGGLKTTAVAVIAIAVFALGCGGSDDSSSASDSGEDASGSSSKAVFVKQGNAACLKQRQNAFGQIAAYEEKHRSEGLPEAALRRKAFKVVILATIEDELAALRNLEVPAGDEEEIEAILGAEQEAFDVASGPETNSYREINSKFRPADEMLRDYGLSDCAKEK